MHTRAGGLIAGSACSLICRVAGALACRRLRQRVRGVQHVLPFRAN